MGWRLKLAGRGDAASDEDAMRRVRANGDPVAFAQLVARWETPIRRLCVRMTGDEHRGEDLTQEAFARAFANRQRFDGSGRFSTWLWRIALNLCYENHRRMKLRSEESFDARDDRPHGLDGPSEHAETSERAAMVRDALARLPELHRSIVVLRQYEGLKFREIADVLGIAEGTAKWRMSEALDQLAESLKPLAEVEEPPESEEQQPAVEPSAPVMEKVSVAL